MTPKEFDEAEAALIERGVVQIRNGLVLPGRNIWTDIEIQAVLSRCHEIVRKCHKGVYAADIDFLLRIDRKYERGKILTLRERTKASFVLPKILWAGATELGSEIGEV